MLKDEIIFTYKCNFHLQQLYPLGSWNLSLVDSTYIVLPPQVHLQLQATDSGAWFLLSEGHHLHGPVESLVKHWLMKGALYDREP